MKNPCKINDNIIQICADNIRLGLSYAACSKAIGITYQTWNNWTKKAQEGKQPYLKWYLAVQTAEADLMRECLESVRLSMRQGNVESAKFILERRFSGEGYGKQTAVNMKAQTENVNVNITPDLTAEGAEQIRQQILSKLAPKQLPEYIK